MIRRNAWVLGLIALFAVLNVVTRIIQPNYGSGDFDSLVRAALPYVFAVAAQVVVVIAGGIDLSVASMMAVCSVTAAAMMAGQSEAYAVFVVPAAQCPGRCSCSCAGLPVGLRPARTTVAPQGKLNSAGCSMPAMVVPQGLSTAWLRTRTPSGPTASNSRWVRETCGLASGSRQSDPGSRPTV